MMAVVCDGGRDCHFSLIVKACHQCVCDIAGAAVPLNQCYLADVLRRIAGDESLVDRDSCGDGLGGA